ncbi:MAG: carboxypeptidase regulatory-like domain-containing protein [Bryobacterales bacterium]|nr:carboxypeptidase regulatory-like domain-containing protein [Bryobacterales bacterium]
MILVRQALLLSLCIGSLTAQTNAHKGRIIGVVLDPAGASVAEAQVTLVNDTTGVVRALRSNRAGEFQSSSVDPGSYTIRAETEGFARSSIEGVVVSVGTTVRVDIPLQIEETTTEIDVAASLIDPSQSTSDNIVNATAIRDLPINGRRFQDFALLTPTVQVDRQRGQLSFVGQRGINANVMVDGTDYNQPFFGGIRGGERSNFVITVPQSAIREFQAVSAGYTAEYGRSSGGILNAITKGGTNKVRADAFHQVRGRDMGAEDPFGEKVLETLRQSGGSVGGPLIRNQAFFFAALERQRADTPRLVEFPRLLRASREAGPEAFDLYGSLEEPFESTNDAWAFTPRVDLHLRGTQTLTFRYNASSATALNTSTTGNPRRSRTNRAVSNNGTEKSGVQYFTGQLTSLLTPAWTNELRVTATREERPRLNNASAPLIQSTIGRFGARSFLPTTQQDTRLQLNNAVSVTSGSHSFKLGVDFSGLNASQNFGFHQFGRFILFGSDVDEHLDCLSAGGQLANRFDCAGLYLRQVGNLYTAMQQSQLALFITDSWRVSRRITLNYGLRWEAQNNPDPQATNSDLVTRVRDADLPFGRTDPAVIPDATDQVMPRFGFAYRPFSKSDRTVLRGSFGIYYAATPLLLMSDPVNNFRATPGNLSLALPTTEETVYQQFHAAGIDLNQIPLGEMPVFSVEDVQRVAGGGTDPFAGAQPITFADDYRNPRSVSFTAGIDHEVTSDFVAGAVFQHVNTANLQRNKDFNLPLPTVRAGDLARIPYINGRNRPISSLGSVTVRESSARSLYRGVTISAKYRPRSSLQWEGFYTWSQTFSDDDNERSATGFGYNDPFALGNDYGPANQDIQHQFTSNAVLTLPLGITWSGIARITSGPPINPVAGRDLNGDRSSWGDRGLSAPGVFLGRNAFRNRGLRNFDMRVMKSIPLTERARVQLSAELFNAFNMDNVEFGGFNTVFGPGLDLGTGEAIGPQPNFMRLRDDDGSYDRGNRQIPSVSPLQLQIGARFFF